MSYYAAALCPDGMPDTVQYGFSVDEAHAASIAVRVANRLECDVVVIDDATGKITQTIRFRPEMIHDRQAKDAPAYNDERVTREYLSNVSTFDEAVPRFIQKFVGEGYTVTITPMVSRWKVPDYMVNLVASKYNGTRKL